MTIPRSITDAVGSARNAIDAAQEVSRGTCGRHILLRLLGRSETAKYVVVQANFILIVTGQEP